MELANVTAFPKDYWQMPHPGIKYEDNQDIIRMIYSKTKPDNYDQCVKATANRFTAQTDPYVFMQLQANTADQATILAMSKLHISKVDPSDCASIEGVDAYDAVQFELLLKHVEKSYLPIPLKNGSCSELVNTLKTIAFNAIPAYLRAERKITKGYRDRDVIICKNDYLRSFLPVYARPYLEQYDPQMVEGYNQFFKAYRANGCQCHGANFTKGAQAFLDKYLDISCTHHAEVADRVGAFATELISRLNERERDPFETAAWAHMEVVKIHPFADANGRTARLLATIILMQAGHKAPIFASDRIYTQAVVEGKANPAALAAYLRTVSQ